MGSVDLGLHDSDAAVSPALPSDAPDHVRTRVSAAGAQELRRGLTWEHEGDRYTARLTREPTPKLVVLREGALLLSPSEQARSAVQLGVAALLGLGLWCLALGGFAVAFDQRFLMLTGHGYNALIAGAALIAAALQLRRRGHVALFAGITVTLLNAILVTLFVINAGGRFPLITWLVHGAVLFAAIRAVQHLSEPEHNAE